MTALICVQDQDSNAFYSSRVDVNHRNAEKQDPKIDGLVLVSTTNQASYQNDHLEMLSTL